VVPAREVDKKLRLRWSGGAEPPLTERVTAIERELRELEQSIDNRLGTMRHGIHQLEDDVTEARNELLRVAYDLQRSLGVSLVAGSRLRAFGAFLIILGIVLTSWGSLIST
jgi:hypothetical protein